MEHLQIQLTANDLQNLLVFLDRVTYKGHKEIDAYNLIMAALKDSSKVDDEDKENE